MQRSPLIIILATVFIALIGFGIVIPLLPVYAERYGASGFEVGLLMMSYSLMQFIVAPLAGRLSDRIGRRPVLLGALALTSASYVLFGLADNLTMLFVSRVLAGIGGADITVAQAYIADVTPPQKRARGMGLFGAAFGVGFIIGPSLTTLSVTLAPFLKDGVALLAESLAASGSDLYRSLVVLGGHLADNLPAYLAALLAGFTALFAFFRLPEPAQHEERRQSAGTKISLSRAVQLLMGLNFITVVVMSLLQGMMVLYNLEKFGWHEKENGLFLAYVGIIAATIQGGLVGKLAGRFGERGLVRVGLLFMAVGMLLFGLAEHIWMLLVGGAIYSVGFAVVLPSLSSQVSQEAPDNRQGVVLGRFQSVGSMARITGPLVGGILYDYIGMSWPFFTAAALALIGGIAANVLLRTSSWQRLGSRSEEAYSGGRTGSRNSTRGDAP